MGCGPSKGETVIESNNNWGAHRAKTPSSASSSGVSSYRRSRSPRQTERPGSHDTSQGHDTKSHEMLLAERQRLEAEKEKLRQEESQHMAEQQMLEEKRHQQLEEEQRRQELEEVQRRHAEEAKHQQEELSHVQTQDTPAPDQNDDTPASDQKVLKKFTFEELIQHNTDVGWTEWIPHRRKVYDGNGFKSYFPVYMNKRRDMLEARAQERIDRGEEEYDEEFHTHIKYIGWDCYPPFSDPSIWQYNGVQILRQKGMTEEELDIELPPFVIGTIIYPPRSVYIDIMRKDVSMLINELNKPSEDPRPSGEQEYLEMLVRWQDKYQYMDPPEHFPAIDGTDPNIKDFPVPVDPETLRLYVFEGEPIDCDLPPEGAWETLEVENIDIGDPHDTFCSLLRLGYSEEEFEFDIDNEAAWEVLPDSVIQDGVMTAQQEEIQAARDKRTDLDDPERMKKRREELSDYFIKTRELAPAVVLPFLQWASLLEAGQAQLDKLCEEN